MKALWYAHTYNPRRNNVEFAAYLLRILLHRPLADPQRVNMPLKFFVKQLCEHYKLVLSFF